MVVALAVASTSALLESWGCEVTAADTQAGILEALQAAASPPDIILSDYQIAASNGLEIIRQLREHFGKPIPAVILSGDTSSATAHTVQEADIPLLHKPVRPAKLRALLQRKTQV